MTAKKIKFVIWPWNCAYEDELKTMDKYRDKIAIVTSIFVAALMTACPQSTSQGTETETETETETGTDIKSIEGTDTAGASGEGSDTESVAETPVDCENLDAIPTSYTTISGPGRSEDFAFDSEGNMISIADGHLLSFSHDGTMSIVVPNVIEENFHGDATSHGLAALPGGDIVFADSGQGAIVRVSESKNITTILAGLPFPNGVTVDQEGAIYVTVVAGAPGDPIPEDLDEVMGKGVVIRVDADSGEYAIVAKDLTLPNGLAFSPDYKTLYIGSHNEGGYIFALDIESGEQSNLVAGVGQAEGNLDGLTVDVCGNVYATEIGSGTVWRISPDGAEIDLVVDLSESGDWIPNHHFGSGHGGWAEQNLYVVNYQKAEVYEINLGVGGVQPPNLE